MAAKLGEVEANTIFDSSAELSDDETTVHVSLKNKSGVEVTGFDIPAGGAVVAARVAPRRSFWARTWTSPPSRKATR